MQLARAFLVLLVVAVVGCGDDSPATPDAGCPAGQQLCGSTCVNTQSDNTNCGACGMACEPGNVCSAGSCQLSCQAGLLACGGTCIDPDTDRAHCGATGDCQGANAGNTCGAGQICNGAGVCQLSCQTGFIACNGTCINPNTDRAFCGATGNCTGANAGDVCDPGQICNGSGVCQLSCQSGLISCNGTCTDPNTNNTYCGASGDCAGANDGAVCPAGQVCNGSGVCAPTCQTGMIVCGGSCVDPTTNLTYCGATGNCQGANDGTVCAVNQACSAGACRDFAAPFTGVTFPIAVPGSTFGLGEMVFGYGGDVFVAGAGAKDIFRISAATGAPSTFATDIVTSAYLLSLAYDANANILYAGGVGSEFLAVSTTGVATSVATISGQVNTLRMIPTGFGAYGGQIIAGTTTGLYVVNQNATPVTVTTISSTTGTISDLVFVGTTLYAGIGANVVTISSTGTVSAPVGTIAASAIDGLAYDVGRNILYVADSNADQLSSMTLAGVVTPMGAFDFDSGFFISGMLQVTPNLLLLGTGENSLTIAARTLP